MKSRVIVLLLAACSCRGRGDELETVSGPAGSVVEPESPAMPPAEHAEASTDASPSNGTRPPPDRDPDRWPVVEPVVRGGQRVCPETHAFPEFAGYYNPNSGCTGGGIAFCWDGKPPPKLMPATIGMVDTSGTCWVFANMPLFFPKAWREPTRGECQPRAGQAEVCPL